MKLLRMWPAIEVATIVYVLSCSPSAQDAKDARDAAACAGIRQLYDEAQTRMIDSGACDHVAAIEACVPHVALREALVLSLEKARCPTL